MIDAMGEGLCYLFEPTAFAVFSFSLVVSLVFGILPGLGVVVALTLALPFIFGMPLSLAMLVMLGLSAAESTSGSVSAILLNMPGTPSNAATIIDGFPMNQNGEGPRAIGAAVISSTVGGILAIPMALLMIPVVLKFIMIFGSPETFMLISIGLITVAFISTGSTVKGLISAGLGVLASFVGNQATTGIDRLTFGAIFLYSGFGLTALALGLFAIAEMMDILLKGEHSIVKIKTKTRLSAVFHGIRDGYRNKRVMLVSSIIGYIIGLIPVAGGNVACFIAYGQAKQTSKHPEKFGKGSVEGVIAPESANNAVVAGALLTTLCLGIPGSVAGIFYLAGFLIVGITPGPPMLGEYLPIAMMMIFSIALGNIIGGAITLFAAPYLARIAQVSIHYLFPAVLVVVFCGVFAEAEHIWDFLVVIAFGLVGYILKKFGYNRPAFLLGYVLGLLFEKYFFLSLRAYGPFFWTSPLCLLMIAGIIILFTFPYLRQTFNRFWRRTEA